MFSYSHKLRIVLVVLAALFVATPSLTLAACNPEDDGDCCARDADCAVFLNPFVCVNTPLNRAAVKRLEQEAPAQTSNCPIESIAELKAEQKNLKVKCIDEACNFEPSVRDE